MYHLRRMIEETTNSKNINISENHIQPTPKKSKMSHVKTGRYISTRGYVMILKQDHPFTSMRGYMCEHRLVMEQHLGRYLTKQEEVHHINGNKLDNRIENLQLISPSEHMKLHMKGNDHGKYNKKDMTGRFCKLCGSTTTYINKEGHADWAVHDGGFLCRSCVKKLKYIEKEIRTKLF